MIVNEIFNRAIPGYQDLEDDKSTNQGLELRKTRLTLKQINKLRIMNDIRTFERDAKLTQIRKQYGEPAAEGDDLGF